MKLLSAVLDRTDLHLSIWLDESRTIDDPGWVRPTVADPEVPDLSIPVPQVPDPAWVIDSTYGGVASEKAVESAIREATLVAEVELSRRTPLPEKVEDSKRPDVRSLLDAPVDIAEAVGAVAGKVGAPK